MTGAEGPGVARERASAHTNRRSSPATPLPASSLAQLSFPGFGVDLPRETSDNHIRKRTENSPVFYDVIYDVFYDITATLPPVYRQFRWYRRKVLRLSNSGSYSETNCNNCNATLQPAPSQCLASAYAGCSHTLFSDMRRSNRRHIAGISLPYPCNIASSTEKNRCPWITGTVL